MRDENNFCGKCGSEKIIPRAMAIDSTHNSYEGTFTIAVDEDPSALIFNQRARSGVFAVVCGDCGYTEFYVIDPESLYVAYQNQKTRQHD